MSLAIFGFVRILMFFLKITLFFESRNKHSPSRSPAAQPAS
jgi:hypothetical protein